MRKEQGWAPHSFYDAILHGVSIESLTIGALLAKRGKGILILTSDEDWENLPFFSHEGFLFEAYPSFWLGTDPELSHPALEELGISPNLQLLDPGFQVVLPRHRLSLYREEDLWGREIRREFPQLEEAMTLFFKQMKDLQRRMGGFLERDLANPPRDLRTRWEQRKDVPFFLSAIMKEGKPPLSPHLKTLGEDGETCSLIDALLRGFGGVRGKDCSLLFASTLFALLREPIYYLPGGVKGVYEALLASFQTNGGKLRTTSQGLYLIRERKKVRGLATAGGEEFLAHTILGGPGLWQICRAAISQEEADQREKRLPLNETLILFLGVDEEVLPQEMRENLLLVPDSARSFPEGDPIWILLSPPGDETRAPHGKRALSAILPLSPHGPGKEKEGEANASELMRKLEDFLPFLSQHLHFRRAHVYQSFSMLYPGRRWGFRIGIGPLRQMGYPGPRPFSPQPNLFLVGDLPVYGIGVRARIDAGYYWANLLAPSREG